MNESTTQVALALSDTFIRQFPLDAARAAGRLPLDELVELMELEALTGAVQLWEHLPADIATDLLPRLERRRACELLVKGDPVRNARVLARLAAQLREEFLGQISAIDARELRQLAEYPQDSAGALMDTRFAVLQDSMTADYALERIRNSKPRFTRQLYLTDADGRLTHMVELTDLALAETDARVGSLARPVPAAVLTTAVREEVVEKLGLADVTDLPVVDGEGRLVGVILHQAIMTAVREETSADILSMAGVSADERAFSSVGFVVRKRLPWLQINLLTAFLAAAVVGIFESTIAQVTALAVLLPVVAGQSGNTGAQALAVTMRGLALREIATRHWRRVALKEIGAGFINGVAIALTTAAGVWVWSSSLGMATVVGVSMVISMVAAGFTGVIVPITLSWLGQDPAQSASVILTTVTDVTGFFTFLGIATLMLGTL